MSGKYQETMKGLQIVFNQLSTKERFFLVDYWTQYLEALNTNPNWWTITDATGRLEITVHDDLIWSIPLSSFRFGVPENKYQFAIKSITLHNFADGMAMRSHPSSYLKFDFLSFLFQ